MSAYARHGGEQGRAASTRRVTSRSVTLLAFIFLGFRVLLPWLIESGVRHVASAVVTGTLGGEIRAVDAGQVLHMPGYDVQLLATSIGSTPVASPSPDPVLYPARQGTSVSFEILLTSTSSQTVSLPQTSREISLQLVDINRPGYAYDFPVTAGTFGEPGSPMAQVGSLPPRGSTSGWVSFVAPSWAEQVIHLQGSDLEFAPLADSGYEPEIRLWKAATVAGAAAAGLSTSSAPPA